MIDDWRTAPTFGAPPPGIHHTIRPSAYGVIEDDRQRIALVRTPEGLFLPGGGIEGNETPVEAVVREAREECGFGIRIGTWIVHAVHFVYSEPERTHYEKRCTFVEASVETVAPTGGIEPDHELVWMPRRDAQAAASHESQRWAIGAWVGRAALVLCALVTLGACATAHPENPALDAYPPGVSGVTDVVYYDIHGRTAAELVAEMRRLGPKLAGGASYFGETSSPMQWTWRTRVDGQMCYATEVRIRITAQITLPRWSPPADATPDLATQWRQFLGGLERHEVGHKDISARAAHDIQQRVSALRTFCSNFSDESRRITGAIVERLRGDQARYDTETRHGGTQGATFPPRPLTRATLPPPKR